MKLSELRKLLHRFPDLSDNEENTSKTIVSFLQPWQPDEIITGIGGHGIAAVYNGNDNGATVVVRCELDALPIQESLNIPHRSEIKGVSHKCGHDGHMAIVSGLAQKLYEQRPRKGSVVLLYQPAEETGQGAGRVLDDEKFRRLNPDYILALHNLPGFELGRIIVRKGVFASTSVGMSIKLKGKTSHAGEPEAGTSPALAVAQLIPGLSSIPQFHTALHESAQITIIHAKVGEIAFGTSPGEGEVMITLRAHSHDVLDSLTERAADFATRTADVFGLEVTVDIVEPFPTTINDPKVVDCIEKSARKANLKLHRREVPFAWSEDFGHFTKAYPGALFGIGAGEKHPSLHHPDYDFPEELIEHGITIFDLIIRQLIDGDHV